MDSIEEKRVYGDRTGAHAAYVTSSMGVVRVRVADETVGEFGLCERCDARDVAATANRVAIATDEDVRVAVHRSSDDRASAADGSDGRNGTDEPAFEKTGFGEAVAVGYDGPNLIAAAPDGTIGCRRADGDEWATLEDGTIATVRAIDGDLIGTDSGVYRVHDGGLDHVGLTDVRDVSAAGVPLAATAEGLYKLGNGWMELASDAFTTVASDPRTDPGQLLRAHAVADDGTIHALTADGGEWTAHDGPAESVVAVGYGSAAYAVTDDGSFLAFEDATGDADGFRWRSHVLGITGVTGLAVASWTGE